MFFASDMARYVTGASLLMDGGLFVNLQSGVGDSPVSGVALLHGKHNPTIYFATDIARAKCSTRTPVGANSFAIGCEAVVIHHTQFFPLN